MNSPLRIKRDTPQWVFQTWTSFIIAVVLCTIGVWNLPSQGEQPLLAMGYVFSLFAALALSKMLRDNQEYQVDTASWKGTCWAAFAIAMGMTGWGLYRMNFDSWGKGYLAITWLFMVSSAFTLAKTLRDAQEAEQAEQAHFGSSQASMANPAATDSED